MLDEVVVSRPYFRSDEQGVNQSHLCLLQRPIWLVWLKRGPSRSTICTINGKRQKRNEEGEAAMEQINFPDIPCPAFLLSTVLLAFILQDICCRELLC